MLEFTTFNFSIRSSNIFAKTKKCSRSLYDSGQFLRKKKCAPLPITKWDVTLAFILCCERRPFQIISLVYSVHNEFLHNSNSRCKRADDGIVCEDRNENSQIVFFFLFFSLKKKEEKQPTIVHPNGLAVGYLAAFAGSATIIIIIVIAPLPPTVRYTLYLHTFSIFVYSNRMTVADVVVLVLNAQRSYIHISIFCTQRTVNIVRYG